MVGITLTRQAFKLAHERGWSFQDLNPAIHEHLEEVRPGQAGDGSGFRGSGPFKVSRYPAFQADCPKSAEGSSLEQGRFDLPGESKKLP